MVPLQGKMQGQTLTGSFKKEGLPREKHCFSEEGAGGISQGGVAFREGFASGKDGPAAATLDGRRNRVKLIRAQGGCLGTGSRRKT